ncbi:MAG: patatin-like phospholipase family protein [Rhodobacteraceae bacterium]|nr:patatin-like phospholipase family protein [Paracoccaceae bacterium]
MQWRKSEVQTILSLDGGGIRGLISARILQEFESQSRQRIHELFDLVVDTSTGGILAAGLARPMNEQGGGPCPAEDPVRLFAERGRELFSRFLWKGVTSL